MKTIKTLSWLVVLVGAWEVIAPFVLGYTTVTGALSDAIILGIGLLSFAGWAALSNDISTIRSLNWINVILGVWLISAPFIIGYTSVAAALWNDIIVGLVAALLAGWAAIVATNVRDEAGGHLAG